MLLPHLHTHKEQIFKSLQAQGLGVQVHYKPIYQFSLYKNLFGEMSLPNADNFYLSTLSIPCHQALSMEQAQDIANIVLKECNKIR